MFKSLPALLDALLFACTVFCLLRLASRKNKHYPHPPGPKGLPLIGNALDLPRRKGWLAYAKWGEQYGGIMRLSALGQSFIIINDIQAAFDILDKKGTLYADRPKTTMLELCGHHRSLACLPYGRRFRENRKLFAKIIGSGQSIRKFHPIIEYHSSRFLKFLLDNPASLEQAVRKTAGAIAMQVAYGYDVKDEGRDPLIEVVEKAVAQFSYVSTPGRYLVDLLPVMRYIPSWFPGAGFQKDVALYRQSLDDMMDWPMKFVQGEIDKGKNVSSFAGDLILEEAPTDEKLCNIKWAAGSFYAGGSDTTIGTLLTYFLAMSVYPDVQKKVHAELDTVVGHGRLPSFDDRDSLPYLEATCKELYRWLPIAPLGLPHQATQDDVYTGYLLPKGSIVIANIWKFLHDPATYADPFSFNPDRFLGPRPERNPMDISFGFGRRICPGMNLADATVWSSISKAAFGLNITKAVDAAGNVIEPIIGQTDGTISRPLPFECTIVPRDKHVVDLIKVFEVAEVPR